MIKEQLDFWSSNPCGADGDLSELVLHRHRMEPWLSHELKNIPTNCKKYLEVGCGQGVDSFSICALLDKECEYSAIDYSIESLKRASNFIEEANSIFSLKVVPNFLKGNALALDFKDEEFDFVYSMGVIHHTPDPQLAINEIFRVLKEGGKAKIFVYRRNSLKVGVAKSLRFFQAVVDKFFFQDRIIYKLLRQRKSRFFGSMFLECFGVPWMEWFSDQELRAMFHKFNIVEIKPCGFNLPFFLSNKTNGYNVSGYFYKIDATK